MTILNRAFLLLSIVVLFCQFGCVGRSTYQKKVEQTTRLTRDLNELQQRNSELGRENDGLRSEQARLLARVEELEAGNRNLEQMLTAKSEPSYGIVAALEREKSKLSEDLARLLSAREEKVRDVSRIYESLLEGMKDEIAAGRMTVSELRGTVTIAVRDDAFFKGDRGEMNPAGTALFLKLAQRLKGAGENEICIANTFEIPETVSAVAGINANPAVIPSARAMAIARLMRKQGIEPGNLFVVALGEFAPVRNAGRAVSPGKAPCVEITVSATE